MCTHIHCKNVVAVVKGVTCLLCSFYVNVPEIKVPFKMPLFFYNYFVLYGI